MLHLLLDSAPYQGRHFFWKFSIYCINLPLNSHYDRRERKLWI